ncbi:PadR family transcriptional regulator [Parvularcula maris]|uniref:PadR family transcriptional regulator n=1 Tax=Parvularcula maris TaxID=2965077 RepID=A0A9X2L9D4_9PROT|nr:PadR family transcriptional regulator [Parvularcula maris]MCQ8185334.1 PadR family transcriptional regulator [Parvularcula maris]
MKLTVPDLVVLSVLVRAGPMHGYDLWQRLSAADVRDWVRVSRPQTYYSLRKLTEGGYLQRVEASKPSGGPERTTVRAAASGKRALWEALALDQWVERPPPHAFVTWAAMAAQGDPAVAQQQIERHRAILSGEITREEDTLFALDGKAGVDAAVARALVRMAIRRMRADLASLDEVADALALASWAEDGLS